MVHTEIFDSLQSFADTVNKRKVNQTFKNSPYALVSQVEGDIQKYGTESFSEANNMLNTGDNSNLSKLKSANIKSISHSSDYIKNMLKIEKNVCGCLPNIPLYLIGAPNNMLNFKRTQTKSKVINILVNIAVSYDVTAKEIVEAGANIASVVRELEKNGIRVNLYVSCFSKKLNDYIGFVANIKKSSAPLNMLNITYPLINPSMLRRHFFRYIETVPVKIDKGYTENYGHVTSFNTMLKQEPKLNKFKDAVIIDIQNMIGASVSDMVKTISEKTK